MHSLYRIMLVIFDPEFQVGVVGKFDNFSLLLQSQLGLARIRDFIVNVVYSTYMFRVVIESSTIGCMQVLSDVCMLYPRPFSAVSKG